MMLKTVLFAVLLTFTACKKKEDKAAAPAPSDKPAATDTAKPAEPPPAAPAAATKLDCDKILSKDLRDKYFANMEIKDEPAPMPEIGKCSIEPGTSGAKSGGSVQAICNDAQKVNRDQILKAMLDADKQAKPIDGVPQSMIKELPSATQVTAYDQDSNCNVSVTLPKGIDAVAFTKDWLAALPPK
jgi:hypothetical protein